MAAGGTSCVRPATAGDVDAVAEALGAAFVGDPWIAWIVAPDHHQERIRGLQAGLLSEVGMPFGEVWLAEEGGSVVAAALWLLAERQVPAPVWARLSLTEPDLMGDHRHRAAGAAAATRHLRPSTPHHLLATLGVVAARRRKGIGAALLAPVLARADRYGVDAYLETSTEQNLRFYAGLGFEVTGHVVVPGGGPPVWAMLRRPRGTGVTPAARS